ncbi:plasminogen activator inhibitor 2 [Orycteropus afer afer]|uniref:Plasminogen activator inhibitor 2 n=1 Tax=Orycteropus afer afer TaxID=1230840 RepID=A0A8B6ZF65_ORYAF|nr:plasminogen activator inhibitor 2 [Orycteropus afer afer]
MQDLYVANTIFALNLFKYLVEISPSQNLLFSPWSISSTMAMVYLGARGNTADQMAQVLQFNKVGDHERIPVAPKNFTGCEIVQQIQKSPYPEAILQSDTETEPYVPQDPCLSSAYKLQAEDPISQTLLWFSKTQIFHCNANSLIEYMQLSKKYYSIEPQAVDFLECAEEARRKINSWVNTQTKGKIPNLLPEGSVDEETRMVLVNAVYFKGKWKTPFQKKLNGLYPFRVNALEGEITYDKLSKWISEDTMAEDDVEVYLPKFKLEEHYELKPILSSMGMSDAFSRGQANFLGMSEGNDLFLSEVFHQAAINVDEEGTEAAAGTGAIMTGRTGHGGPQFVADHPFLFFISHRVTKTILFLGRFSSP